MSTRANIVILDNRADTKSERRRIYVYHHHDGYVEGVGADIMRLIQAQGYKMTTTEETERIILAHSLYDDAPKPGDYEKTDCIHGDIEYLYIVELQNGYKNSLRISLRARQDTCDERTYELHNPLKWGKPLDGYGCNYIADWCQEELLAKKGKELADYTNEELLAELSKRLTPPTPPKEEKPTEQNPAEIPCNLPALEDFEPTAEELINKAVADLQEEQDTTTEQTEEDDCNFEQLSLFAC